MKNMNRLFFLIAVLFIFPLSQGYGKENGKVHEVVGGLEDVRKNVNGVTWTKFIADKARKLIAEKAATWEELKTSDEELEALVIQARVHEVVGQLEDVRKNVRGR